MSAPRPIDLVRGRLEQAGRTVRRGMAQCPAHDDSTPSLSIRNGDDGRVLLHCFAGCETGAILEALDLNFHHLFPENTWPDYLREPASSPSTSRSLDALPLSGQNPSPDPGPGTGKRKEGEEPEIYGLLRDHASGKLPPIPVPVREIPRSALPKNLTFADAAEVARVATRVARHMALLVGLRLAVLEDRPLPYATAFCAAHVAGVRNKAHASRLLRLLERAAVIRCVGQMPRRAGGPRDGTLLYEIVPLPTAPIEVPPANAVESLKAGQLVKECVGVERATERRDQVSVERAEVAQSGVAPARPIGMVTTGNGASRHVADGNSRSGGAEAEG